MESLDETTSQIENSKEVVDIDGPEEKKMKNSFYSQSECIFLSKDLLLYLFDMNNFYLT